VSPFVFAVVLAAAFLHAGWNTLVKQGGDPYLRIGVIMLTGSLLAAGPALFLAPPPAAARPWLVSSILAHTVYYATLARGYQTGDLSQVYPIARGLAPPLVALGGALAAGERLGLGGMLAIALVAGGIMSLALAGSRWRRDRRAIQSAFVAGCAIAVYTLSDGLGARASQTAWHYITWLFLLEALPFGLFVLWWRRDALQLGGWRPLLPAFGGGAMSTLAYALVIWAMSLAPMAYVSAVRESSVVLAAWMGIRLLGEPFGRIRLVSAGIVTLGVVLLHLAR